MEIELKLFDYSILVDIDNPKEAIQTANGLINDLELYKEYNESAKYARTREALNTLFESMLKTS